MCSPSIRFHNKGSESSIEYENPKYCFFWSWTAQLDDAHLCEREVWCEFVKWSVITRILIFFSWLEISTISLACTFTYLLFIIKPICHFCLLGSIYPLYWVSFFLSCFPLSIGLLEWIFSTSWTFLHHGKVILVDF